MSVTHSNSFACSICLRTLFQKVHILKQGIKAIVASFVMCCLVACNRAEEGLIGRVIRVADGDTLTVLDAANNQHKIRLQGIDAPESKQAFAKNHLKTPNF